MNFRFHLFTLSCIAFFVGAVGTAASVYLLRQSVAQQKIHRLHLKQVVVASRDLATGELVTEEGMATRKVPEELVTASFVGVDDFLAVKNQRLLVPVAAGDPILWTHFAMGAPENFCEFAREAERTSGVLNSNRREELREKVRTLQ